MTNHVLLDNVTHKDLKVITRPSAEFGDNVNSVLTFPTEFDDVQREYPILFRKTKEGEYQSVALLGLVKDENLFLDEELGWQTSYVPSVLARGPFLIGFQEREEGGEIRRERVIHVDMDDPRVNETEGQSVFLEHGGNSPYLERIATILKAIHQGLNVNKAMFAAFEEYELIEPVRLEVEVHSDEKINLTGFHTINEDKLAALDGAALEKLNKAGFLRPAFMVVASLANITKLIEMRRQRLLKSQ